MRFLVAPNLMHHLKVGEWAAAYRAKVLARGLRRKRPDLRIDVELESGRRWKASSEVAVRGMPMLDSSFFHRPNKTVLLTDMSFQASTARARGSPGCI